MLWLRTLLPYLASLWHFLLLEIVFSKPALAWLVFVDIVGVVLSAFLIAWLKTKKLKGKKGFLLQTFLFIVGCSAGLLFIESALLRHVLLVGQTFLLWLFLLSQINFSTEDGSLAQSGTSELVSLFVFLHFSIALFGLHIFMNVNIVYVGLLASFLATLSAVLFLGPTAQKTSRIAVLNFLLFFQFFLSLSWFPFNLYIKALLFGSLFYLLLNLEKTNFKQGFVFKKHFLSILITLIVVLACFIGSRWI